MRLSTFALGVLFPAAAVLSGCGMGRVAAPNAMATSSKAMTGRAFGGQQPLSGAVIALYSYGTSGYGSTGTVLARTTTDSNGNFNIDPSAIQCPSDDTPLYILSIGGNPGSKNNPAISLAAGLGTCSNAVNAYVTINEISTAMLAYTFSRFFSSGSNDGVTTDHFGAPATAAQVITTGNSGTLPTLIDTQNSYPRPNSSSLTFEGAKLITLGNILGACVNSVGTASPSCSALFKNSTPSGGSAPANTLEAAVNVAKNPMLNVSKLFAIQPTSGAAAFSGGLTSAPTDWTLSASFTSPNFALGVDDRSVSTIDIDTTGRIWFPSNGSGAAGVGYFDPLAGSFSPLYTANLTHPQQVAIDFDGYVWANDSGSANVAGFPSSNPSSPTILSLNGTTSTTVTIAVDNSVRYGIVATNGKPALASVSNQQNYSLVQNTQLTGVNYFFSSIAGDSDGGIGIGAQRRGTGTTENFYVSASGSTTSLPSRARDSGQVAWTGSDFVQVRGGYGARQDGLCIFSAQTCYSMKTTGQRHPAAIAVDGAQTLWLADNDGPTVEAIPLTSNSYVNSNDLAVNTIYSHDSANGGTLAGPAGIAVDGAGNVWVSNYGCYGASCSPGNSFTLSEILGAGAPTLTPVSQPIVTDPTAPAPLRKGNASPKQ